MDIGWPAHAVDAARKLFLPAACEPASWVYEDPSGNRQGPFVGSLMLEWFSGGFMHDGLMPLAQWLPTSEPVFRSLESWLVGAGYIA